jgi:hypothetical protein
VDLLERALSSACGSLRDSTQADIALQRDHDRRRLVAFGQAGSVEFGDQHPLLGAFELIDAGLPGRTQYAVDGCARGGSDVGRQTEPAEPDAAWASCGAAAGALPSSPAKPWAGLFRNSP